MTVWNQIDRARFVKDVADLQKSGQWQNVPHKGSVTAPRCSVKNQILPAATEMLIADHFSFLAAWKPSPGSVAAATAVAVPPNGIQRHGGS